MEFLELPSDTNVPSLLSATHLVCEKVNFSNQIRLLHTRKQVWSEFQARETPCTQAGPREQWAAECLHCPEYKRGLGGEKARVAF